MALINARFPLSVAYGSEGGPTFETTIVPLDDGSEQRLSRWPVGRHQYNARGGIVESEAEYKAILAAFHACRGRRHTFRWFDADDYKTREKMTDAVTHTDCELVDASGQPAIGDGATTVFYLAKKYVFGTETVYRPIKLPVVATTLIGVDGVLQSSGVTISDTTGAVTFSVAPAIGAVLTCGTEFDVEVRFDVDYLPGQIVDRQDDGQYLITYDIPLIEA